MAGEGPLYVIVNWLILADAIRRPGGGTDPGE